MYLAAVAVIALIMLAVIVRVMPRLTLTSKKRTKEELLVLGSVLLLGLVAIYGLFYTESLYFAYGFGDIGTDTIEQYVPFYSNLIGNVRDGSLSIWSFEYELGTNNAGYQSWMYDPFNLILIPLGLILGDAHLSLTLVITHSTKLIISAYLFDHLLTRYCETPLSRIFGSLLYAFSGFMVLYGQHYWFGSAFPIFTWVLLAFELYLESPRVRTFIGVTLAAAVMLAWTEYVAFMVLLFAAIYLLLRIPVYMEELSFKKYLQTVGKMFLPVICGVLLAAITLVPYVYFLLVETSRTASSAPLSERIVASLISFIDLSWMPAVLSRFLGSGLINTGFNAATPSVSGVDNIGGFTYEFIMMGYSGLAFVLIGQFFHYICTETDVRTKKLVFIASVLFVLYCFHQFLPTLFTVMVRLQYRSSFVLAVPACAAISVGFEKRVLQRKINLASLAVSLILTLAVLLWSTIKTENGRLICLYYLACLIFVAGLLLALRQQRSQLVQNALVVLIIAATVSSSVVDGFFTTNCRRTVSAEDFPLSGKSAADSGTVAALEWLKEYDDTFYRIDKTYSDWSPLNDSLIQHYDSVSAYNSMPDSDVDEFYNKEWLSAISTWAVYSQGFKNSPNSPEVLGFLNVKYILSKNDLAYDWLKLIATFDNVRVYRNTYATSIATIYSSIMSELEADSLETAEDRAALLATSVVIPENIAANAASLPELSEEPTSTFKKVDETHIQGTITVSDRAAVCIAIPNTGEWILTIDGDKQQEPIRGNYGFMAFTVTEGEHQVILEYHMPYEGLSIGMTVGGIALTAIIAFAYQMYEKRTPVLED